MLCIHRIALMDPTGSASFICAGGLEEKGKWEEVWYGV